jgi:hypothetical protein
VLRQEANPTQASVQLKATRQKSQEMLQQLKEQWLDYQKDYTASTGRPALPLLYSLLSFLPNSSTVPSASTKSSTERLATGASQESTERVYEEDYEPLDD